MEALLNRYRHLTVLVVVIFAQLLLLAWQVKTDQDVRLIRVWAVTAVTPLARALEFLRANTIGIAENYFVLVNVREENQRLSRDNGRLKLENQFLKTELQTAERARLLSAFQERTPSRTLAARIIGNGTGTNSKVVFIDRGSTAGVTKGMAVVTPDGIVGKVIGAYPTASQVQLITDGTFSAGVVSEKHRVHGTVKGTGESKTIVDYVQNEETVDKGEMFYTSGYDRVFPRGLPVGSATVVRNGKEHKDIYLVPAAFQHPLEEVLVVLEGVHQNLPERNAVSTETITILPAPPSDGSEAPPDLRSALTTEADRLRDRYKKIGEAQNHKFGEGLPGSKPPDFNLNPDPKPQTAAAPPQAGAPTGQQAAGAPAVPQAKPPATSAAQTQAPAVFGTKPQTPAPAKSTPSVAGTKPATTGATTSATSAGPSAGAPIASRPKPAGNQTSVAGTKPTTTGATTSSTPAGSPPGAPVASRPKPAGSQTLVAGPLAAKPKPAQPVGQSTATQVSREASPPPAAAKPRTAMPNAGQSITQQPAATKPKPAAPTAEQTRDRQAAAQPSAAKPKPAAPKQAAPATDETSRSREATPAKPKPAPQRERSVNLPIP